MGDTLKMKECDTMRILVVEDDRLLNNTLCYNLNTAGYTVDSALTKSVASSFLTKQDYDLIVLDVNLPDGNGFDFCREIKERRPDTVIIFLTANDMESDMLKGYELGAEDYVTKPFPMSVFQKKLAVVLSRLTKQYGGDTYEDGTLTINFSEMSATLSGKPLTFTPLEYRLLKILMKNPQIVLTRQVLLEKLWDADENFVDEHALTAAISRVRNKIETPDRQYMVLVYKCRQKKLNSLYYKKKEQRRCSTWRKIKNRILRNSSNRSSISTMPEVPHILNWNMNMA